MVFKNILATFGISAVSAINVRRSERAEDEAFQQKKKTSQKMRLKYPQCVPVICEKAQTSKNIPTIDKNQFLVPSELRVGQFIFVIRKRINIESDKALFLFIGNSVAPTSMPMSQVDEMHRDADGFLYVTYSGEETFGGEFADLREAHPNAEVHEIWHDDLEVDDMVRSAFVQLGAMPIDELEE